jgi:hypothetical protein
MDILNMDIEYGTEREEPVIMKLRQYFNDNGIYKTEPKFCQYDALSYENPKTAYEIKSRRCKKDTYPTTLIPVSKCFNMSGYDIVFVFNFEDKLFYIKFDYEKFTDYEKQFGLKTVCRERAGGMIAPVINYQIPVADLIEIVL